MAAIKTQIEEEKKLEEQFFDDREAPQGYRFDKENHVHTFNGKPLIGTSRVGDVIAKNLVWWSAELAAVECLEKGESIPTIRKEYEDACKSGDKKKAIDALQKKYPLFKKARFAHYEYKNKSAEKGTDMHAELENYVKKCLLTGMGIPLISTNANEFVQAFSEWAIKNVKRFLWSEIHSYSEYLWLGGISDCGIEDMDGKVAVIDFKSSKEAFPTQFWQATGYAMQLEENGGFTAEGKKVFTLPKLVDYCIIVPFGAEKVEPKMNYDMQGNKEAFLAALTIMKQLDAIK